MTSEKSRQIRVPKDVREFMPDWIEETILGDPQGSCRQYRYGNLHIREYDSEYAVHTDKVDPRKDKLGHLIHDAPEVLVGIGCGLVAGYLAYKITQEKRQSGDKDNDATKKSAAAAGIATAISSASASYAIAKEIRRRLSEYDDQNSRSES